MHKFSVFRGVSIRGEFAVKLGILKWHVLITMSTFFVLLCPLQGFELAANHRLSTFVVPEFFDDLSAKCKEQKRIRAS